MVWRHPEKKPNTQQNCKTEPDKFIFDLVGKLQPLTFQSSILAYQKINGIRSKTIKNSVFFDAEILN